MSFTLWLTGISGSGKSTLSKMAVEQLQHVGLAVELLDGDNVRSFLGDNLGYSARDRRIQASFLGLTSLLLNKNGITAVVASISPYAEVRRYVRTMIPCFVEIFCDCTLQAAANRDPKGLYALAFAGKVPDFTEVSAPYERPIAPEVRVPTDQEPPEASLVRIMDYLQRNVLNRPWNRSIPVTSLDPENTSDAL